MEPKAKTSVTQITRSDDDRQIIYGEVYAPNRLDTHGEMMLASDIEIMAHRFMRLDLTKAIDTNHDNVPVAAYPVESFIAREGDPDYTPGAWVMGVKIDDPTVWADIKRGAINGFSFQAMVKPMVVDVEVEVVRDQVGKTEETSDHEHYFFVQLDSNGRVTGGRTSKAADGHYHEIVGGSVTKKTDGHSHRFFI
jgi:hypothetical protein